MNKTIYICYKTLPEIEKYSKNWEKLNPDWKIQLYDDKLCKKFLLENYSQLHVDIFDFIPDGPIKADFWRVCILNKYGGLYVDADIEPIKKLDSYIDEDDHFVTCISALSPNHHMNPHFILSYKDNPILEECINKYIKFYKDKKKYKYWDWSVVTMFNNIKLFKENIKKKGAQVIEIDNKKYKFLQENSDKNKCLYDGEPMFNNRYKIYKNHKFVK